MGVLSVIRHGQASFGTDDYDRLSPNGQEQSRILGRHFAASGVMPTSMIAGSMVRQQQTAEQLLAAMGSDIPLEIDASWNELNASEIIAQLPEDQKLPGHRQNSRIFQTVLEDACRRWSSGNHDDEYAETYTNFISRIDAAWQDAVERSGSGKHTMVATSSGVLAWVAARMVNAGFEQWLPLNRATINTSVTKIIVDSAGPTMLSYNSHDHLPADMVTFP